MEDTFKLGVSAAASAGEFCEWFPLGIDVYNPPRKYQVKPHSSPWFSVAFPAAIAARLASGNKTKESITSQTLGCRDF